MNKIKMQVFRCRPGESFIRSLLRFLGNTPFCTPPLMNPYALASPMDAAARPRRDNPRHSQHSLIGQNHLTGGRAGAKAAASGIFRFLLCFLQGNIRYLVRRTVEGAAWHNPGSRGAMISKAADYLFLTIAAAPFIYYVLVLYSSWLSFGRSKDGAPKNADFTPPVSNLKPVRGLDPEAYENFSSYCRQDYPDYEILFCIGDTSDPVFPVLQRLVRDFPERQIRIVIGSGRVATNDKVAKLTRLVEEASHEYLVISDSDVRVEPDYLRKV